MSLSLIEQDDQRPNKRNPWIIWGIAGAIGLIAFSLATFIIFNTKWPIIWGILFAIAFFLIAWLPGFFALKPRQSLSPKHSQEKAFQKSKLSATDTTYLSALILVGLCFTFLFAPGTVPDESYHFNCSYKFSDVLFGQPVNDESFPVRAEDQAFIERLPSSPLMNRASYDQELAEYSAFVGSNDTATHISASTYSFSANLPQVKWPTVLALFLGRLLNLGTIPLFYLGRLANLSYYIVLCWFAVKFTPIGKNAFRIVTLLPMSLHLAGSYSYDAGGMGLMFLLTALLLKALLEKGVMSPTLLFAMPALSFLTMPVKVVYLPITLLVLFIPANRFPSKRIAWLYKGGFILASVAGILSVRLEALLNFSGIDSKSTTDLDIRGTETGTMYSIGFFLSHPIHAIKLFTNSLYSMSDFYIKTTWGGSLGWFQDTLITPQLFGYLFVALLGLSCLKMPSDPTVFHPVIRVVLLAIFACVVGANLLAMATSWTFVTEMTIQGVQGRYFLPALPLTLLGCRPRSLRFTSNNSSRGVLLAMLFVDYWYVTLLIGMILAL